MNGAVHPVVTHLSKVVSLFSKLSNNPNGADTSVEVMLTKLDVLFVSLKYSKKSKLFPTSTLNPEYWKVTFLNKSESVVILAVETLISITSEPAALNEILKATASILFSKKRSVNSQIPSNVPLRLNTWLSIDILLLKGKLPPSFIPSAPNFTWTISVCGFTRVQEELSALNETFKKFSSNKFCLRVSIS